MWCLHLVGVGAGTWLREGGDSRDRPITLQKADELSKICLMVVYLENLQFGLSWPGEERWLSSRPFDMNLLRSTGCLRPCLLFWEPSSRLGGCWGEYELPHGLP